MLKKEEFVKDFINYARAVLEALSSRVKIWITLNEPWCSSVLGHKTGVFAPGKSEEGDSSRECWILV